MTSTQGPDAASMSFDGSHVPREWIYRPNVGPVPASMTYRCACCGGSGVVAHASAWPERCPHCKATPPTLIVRFGGATVAAGRTEP